MARAITYCGYYQGDTDDSMVGVGAGVTLGALPRDVRSTKTWPTRIVLPLNPFSFFIEATLTPQRWAILARVSPLRTVYGFEQPAALTRATVTVLPCSGIACCRKVWVACELDGAIASHIAASTPHALWNLLIILFPRPLMAKV